MIVDGEIYVDGINDRSTIDYRICEFE